VDGTYSAAGPEDVGFEVCKPFWAKPFEPRDAVGEPSVVQDIDRRKVASPRCNDDLSAVLRLDPVLEAVLDEERTPSDAELRL
jgi:hypothetical protein